jgi:hypothetical protein
MRSRRRGAGLAAPALLLALSVGCSAGEPTDDAAATATPTADADESVGAAEAEEAGAAGEPVVVDLDEEQRTPTGTVFRVHRLEVDDLSILVDVEIIVAADEGNITLNSAIGGTEAVIRDDQGNEYPLIPPDDNRNLTLDEGERLEGTLAYQGPLHDGVQSLTLYFNETGNPDGGGLMNQMYPHFTFGPIDIAG